MESNKEKIMRLTKVLLNAAKDYQGQSILVVAGGDSIQSLLKTIQGGKDKGLSVKTMDTISCLKISSDGVRLKFEKSYR